jgi:Tol biopolymer transport system component
LIPFENMIAEPRELYKASCLAAVCLLCLACSPNGPLSGQDARIAFLGGGSNGTLTIFVGDADGSGVADIVEGLPDFVDFAWSPDAATIVYAANLGGTSTFQILTIRVDGTANRRISSDGRMPAWSPDGLAIAYITVNAVTQSFDVFAMDTDGSQVRTLTETQGDEFWPTWSPDGSQIAYEAGSGGRDIFVMDSDGKNSRQITDVGGGAVGAPAWSPDGSQIAFNSTIHMDQDDVGFGQFEIYVMRRDGSGIRRLTHLSNVRRALRFPTWSPDGQFIAFESQTEIEGQIGFIFRVYAVGSDGSDPKEVDFGRGAKSPKWSPQ